MFVKTFPSKMWANLGTKSAAPLKKQWKRNVCCGKIDAKYENAPNLTGCGAELILGRKDYYKKTIHTSEGTGMSLWWMCPCCATENPLPIQEIEINSKTMEKAEWLLDRRDSIVKELLMDHQFNKGLGSGPAEEFLNSLDIELPDYYLESKSNIQPTSLAMKIISE